MCPGVECEGNRSRSLLLLEIYFLNEEVESLKRGGDKGGGGGKRRAKKKIHMDTEVRQGIKWKPWAGRAFWAAKRASSHSIRCLI